LFGAGRKQRIYAPPQIQVQSLDFDDHAFVAPKPAQD
jgi:alpha-D-ribose 1-methylphosphonate 5-phosphate C-P lyase